jgi:hypothetical protein
MNAAIARIILRYVIGTLAGVIGMILVMAKLLDPETVAAFVERVSKDPDLELLLTLAVPVVWGAAVEVWYWAAKRFGWAT